MSSIAAGTQVAVDFVWLGMVVAISFLETPLKFRAEGMTVQLGVAVGRLVFRALNIAEGVFAAVLVVCALIGSSDNSALSDGLCAILCVLLVVGAFVLRPLMDRRVRAGATSDGVPRSHLHLWYVLLEVLKVLALVALGIAYLSA